MHTKTLAEEMDEKTFSEEMWYREKTETTREILGDTRKQLIVTIIITVVMLAFEYVLMHYQVIPNIAFTQAVWTFFHLACGFGIGVASMNYACHLGKKIID